MFSQSCCFVFASSPWNRGGPEMSVKKSGWHSEERERRRRRVMALLKLYGRLLRFFSRRNIAWWRLKGDFERLCLCIIALFFSIQGHVSRKRIVLLGSVVILWSVCVESRRLCCIIIGRDVMDLWLVVSTYKCINKCGMVLSYHDYYACGVGLRIGTYFGIIHFSFRYSLFDGPT